MSPTSTTPDGENVTPVAARVPAASTAYWKPLSLATVSSLVGLIVPL